MEYGQTKRHSMFESITNVIVGYGINLGVQLILYPILHITVSFKQNILIGLIFTVISIARSYTLRRIYNRIMMNGHEYYVEKLKDTLWWATVLGMLFLFVEGISMLIN